MMFLVKSLNFGLKVKKLPPGQIDFLNLVKAPLGINVPISQQEKDKVNKQVDRKLQELQDTGLSRQEILLSKSQKGLPLALDPFFQFIKANRLAREVYIGKNQRFTVEKVVDIALRQDIGPDPSYSRTRDNARINEKGRADLMNDLQERQEKSFDPKSYYANEQTNLNKLYDELKPHQPLRHIYKPIDRYERVKTHQRRLKKYDIHWRNIELLRQFLTPFGNIKPRLSNRLSKSDQKKVKMAIKASRQNCGIPHYGRILGPNKRNITNIHDEVKQIGVQSVNLQTGQVYYSRSRSMDSKEAEHEQKSDTDWRYEQMLKGKHYELWIQKPSFDEIDQKLIDAERYARLLKHQRAELQQKLAKQEQLSVMRKIALMQLSGLKSNEKDENPDLELLPEQKQQLKKSYDERRQSLKKKFQEDPLVFSKILFEDKTYH